MDSPPPHKAAGFFNLFVPAVAVAPAVSGHVTHAQLLVGGTAVKDYYDTAVTGHPVAGANVALGTNQSSATLTVYFDSTHFADAASVLIQMVVNDSGGIQYKANITSNAYNKAYTLGDDVLDGGSLQFGRLAARNASGAYIAMNHVDVPITTAGKVAILAGLPTYTAFYSWTHGLDLPSVFGDCFAFPNSPPANFLYANATDDPTGAMSVTQAVASKSVAIPPYNFAFCDACLTSQNNGMANAFGVNNSPLDQSYLGFTTEEDDSQHNADWSNRFFTDLSNGFNTYDAVNDAITVIGYPVNSGQHAATYLWGDRGTKLHGVYGVVGTQWFK